jgi:hypothetical protein
VGDGKRHVWLAQVLLLFSLKGWNITAQGNALGKKALSCIFNALKGRNNVLAKRLLRPFRAWSPVLSRTQGDALGCNVPAFQAEKAWPVTPDSNAATTCQIYNLCIQSQTGSSTS